MRPPRAPSAPTRTPLSGVHVGAAVSADDEIFTAPNVEIASYPLSVCAERNAVAQAIAAGTHRLRAVAVVSDADTPTPPCGGCRQVLCEFGERDRRDRRVGGRFAAHHWSIDELLPAAFGPDDLDR